VSSDKQYLNLNNYNAFVFYISQKLCAKNSIVNARGFFQFIFSRNCAQKNIPKNVKNRKKAQNGRKKSLQIRNQLISDLQRFFTSILGFFAIFYVFWNIFLRADSWEIFL
jgi:hypothetical protein